MWTAFRAAASGLRAQQQVLDVAGHNLANVQTDGFKRHRPNLADELPTTSAFGDQSEPVGQGVLLATVLADFRPGPIRATGRPLDVAIDGVGLLQVSLPDGSPAYTRNGALTLGADGRLATASGTVLAPDVLIPPGATDVRVEPDGRVVARVGGRDEVELGRLVLARFTNPDGLVSLGGDLLQATEASGEPIVGPPGADGLGRLEPASLEGSNVEVGDEIVRLMQAQRAYGVSARALRTIDEMLQAANALRR